MPIRRRVGPSCLGVGLAVSGCSVLFEKMSLGRTITALMLAVAWCSAAFHCDLESAGLMYDHVHYHGDADHAHGGHQHEEPSETTGIESHDPLWARHVLKDSLAAMATLIVLAALVVLAVWAMGLYVFALARAHESVPRRRPPDQSTVWQFVWRCAPDSAAPPALS